MTDQQIEPVDPARLRSLVAELERMIAGPEQQAIVNADGSPGNVVAGELIEAAWGNATANTINRFANADTDVTIPITGNADVTVSGMTDWIVGGITAPSWAVRANIVTTLSGVFQFSGSGAFELVTRLGVNQGNKAYTQPAGLTQRATMTWCDTIPITTSGAINLAIMARRALGDGVLRVDNQCTCKFTVRFDW